MIEEVVRDGKPVLSTDASLDERFKGQQSVILQNMRSIIAVPLNARGKTIGAVHAANPFRSGHCEETHTAFQQAGAAAAGSPG